MFDTEDEWYERMWIKCKRRKSEDKNNKACKRCKNKKLKIGDDVPKNCPMSDLIEDIVKHKTTLGKDATKLLVYDVKKQIQPFVTNDLLIQILKSETPKWVNYMTLVVAILSLFVVLLGLLGII